MNWLLRIITYCRVFVVNFLYLFAYFFFHKFFHSLGWRVPSNNRWENTTEKEISCDWCFEGTGQTRCVRISNQMFFFFVFQLNSKSNGTRSTASKCPSQKRSSLLHVDKIKPSFMPIHSKLIFIEMKFCLCQPMQRDCSNLNTTAQSQWKSKCVLNSSWLFFF